MSVLSGHTRRLAVAGAGGLLAALALAGCSSDTTDEGSSTASSPSESASESASASTSASTSADVCANADTVQQSLDDLLGTDILQEGTDTVKERAATLKFKVEALVDSVQSGLAPQTAAVKASVDALEQVVGGLTEDPTKAELASIRPSLQAVKTSLEELVSAVQSTC
jgi:hypothetical protein